MYTFELFFCLCNDIHVCRFYFVTNANTTPTLTHVGHRTVVIEGGFGAQSFVVPNQFLPILACLPMHEVHLTFPSLPFLSIGEDSDTL